MKNIYWNLYLVLFYIKILQNAVRCLKMTSLEVNALVEKFLNQGVQFEKNHAKILNDRTLSINIHQ